MAILKIANLGNPVLRIPAQPVEHIHAPDIQQLIDDMLETMRESHHLALAAPQVHRSLQIVTIGAKTDQSQTRMPPSPLVLVNPHVVPVADWIAEDWEHCPSLPRLHGKVSRFAGIEVTAQDRQGQSFTLKASHGLARLIQHEADHLVGKVFPDRMRGFETLAYQEEFERFWLSRSGRPRRRSAPLQSDR
jgi:peptide deformylase